MSADPAQQQQEADTGAPQQRGFFSPFFAQYKSLQFYSKLLTTILQYARSVDAAGKNLRQLVWKELCQFAGRTTPMDESFDSADSNALLEPFINNLLRLPSVNLVSLEIVYESFLQAQRRYPDVFCSMFYPISDQTERQRHPDSIWGNTIQSALLQLNLLVNWVSTLEKLSPVHKKIIWDTCKLIPTFRTAEPLSFRKTIARWTQDPLQNTTSITVMFGAIAFLSYQNVLKHEFYYPNVRVPVFSKEQQAPLVPQPPQGLKSPPVKRPRRGSAAEQQQQQQPPEIVDPHMAAQSSMAPMSMEPVDPNQGMTLAAYQAMLESAGLVPQQRGGKPLSPPQLAAQQQATLAEALDKINVIRRNTASAGVPPETLDALDSLIAAASARSAGSAEAATQLIAATQALATLQHVPSGGTSPAILSLPPPTQSGPAAVNNAAASVTETLSQLMSISGFPQPQPQQPQQGSNAGSPRMAIRDMLQ